MTVAIASDLVRQILAAATATPDEVCGLLFGSREHIIGVSPCRNVAADPARRFEIDPAALIAAHRHARAGGPGVVGHYHSHPNGVATPSPRDAAAASSDGALWLIAAAGIVTAWRAVEAGQVEGRFDPVILHDPLRPIAR